MGMAVFVAAAMIGISYFLGERHKGRETGTPYEAGIKPTGSARLRLDVQFYLVGMLFVIFDLEIVFIIAWAVNLVELGWPGYLMIATFTGVLLAALAYLWKVGALEWGARKDMLQRDRR
jgi:NADH-quinone oxidoreductase subunit A